MPDNANKIEMARQGAHVSANPSALGLGERLRSARKARALSLEHVSEKLHLDESIILALEDERFDVLGASVYVRGHLKAYARLVGLAPDSLLDAFQETENPAEMVATVRRASDHSVTVNPVLWGFWVLVILLALGLGIYLLLGDDNEPRKPAPVASSAEPESRVDVGVPVSSNVLPDEPVQVEEEIGAQAVTIPVVDDATEAETGADLAAATKKEIEQSQEVTPDLAPVMTDQRVRLSLNFLEESWVEISDADRRLLFGLQREGIRRELTGEPPFELLLGNAKGVELRLNDKPYNIPENGITGKVARFAITRAEIE